MRTGSPVTVALSWPQLQLAMRGGVVSVDIVASLCRAVREVSAATAKHVLPSMAVTQSEQSQHRGLR